MEKVKVSFRQQDFNDDMQRHSHLLPNFNAVLAAYNNLGLPALQLSEFKQLFSDARSLIFDKMTNGKEIEVMGFKVNKMQALDLLEKPTGYSALISVIDDTNKQLNCGHYLTKVEIKDGKVVLSKETIDIMTESYTRYAKTEREIQNFQFITEVFEKSEEIFKGKYIDLRDFFDKIIFNNNLAQAGKISQINIDELLAYGRGSTK